MHHLVPMSEAVSNQRACCIHSCAPGRRQAIIWTNSRISLIGPLRTNFNEILIEIQTFSFKEIHFKMSSGNWLPFCLGLNVLMHAVSNHEQLRHSAIRMRHVACSIYILLRNGMFPMFRLIKPRTCLILIIGPWKNVTCFIEILHRVSLT